MQISSISQTYLQPNGKTYSTATVNTEPSEKSDNVALSKAGKAALINDKQVDAKLEHLALPPWMKEYTVFVSTNLGGSPKETYGSKLIGDSDRAKQDYAGLVQNEFRAVLNEAGISGDQQYYTAFFVDQDLSKLLEQRFLDKIDLLNENS
ncbi:MAG: hypothetical protein MJK10_18925 [Pseudomonadales bacterium]|nr:hypothetical protein [Pseudomonadales bacterium]NRA18361.1 hypothetical protein [Oceanospirillaceae bacterium]